MKMLYVCMYVCIKCNVPEDILLHSGSRVVVSLKQISSLSFKSKFKDAITENIYYLTIN